MLSCYSINYLHKPAENSLSSIVASSLDPYNIEPSIYVVISLICSLCAVKNREYKDVTSLFEQIFSAENKKKNATSMHDSLCAIRTEKDIVNVLFSCAIKVTDNKRRYIDAMFSLCY